jgi:hypothetical protein
MEASRADYLWIPIKYRLQLCITYAIEHRSVAEIVDAVFIGTGIAPIESRIEYEIGDVRGVQGRGVDERLWIDRRVHRRQGVVDVLAPARLIAARMVIPAGNVDEVLSFTPGKSIEVRVSNT